MIGTLKRLLRRGEDEVTLTPVRRYEPERGEQGALGGYDPEFDADPSQFDDYDLARWVADHCDWASDFDVATDSRLMCQLWRASQRDGQKWIITTKRDRKGSDNIVRRREVQVETLSYLPRRSLIETIVDSAGFGGGVFRVQPTVGRVKPEIEVVIPGEPLDPQGPEPAALDARSPEERIAERMNELALNLMERDDTLGVQMAYAHLMKISGVKVSMSQMFNRGKGDGDLSEEDIEWLKQTGRYDAYMERKLGFGKGEEVVVDPVTAAAKKLIEKRMEALISGEESKDAADGGMRGALARFIGGTNLKEALEAFERVQRNSQAAAGGRPTLEVHPHQPSLDGSPGYSARRREGAPPRASVAARRAPALRPGEQQPRPAPAAQQQQQGQMQTARLSGQPQQQPPRQPEKPPQKKDDVVWGDNMLFDDDDFDDDDSAPPPAARAGQQSAQPAAPATGGEVAEPPAEQEKVAVLLPDRFRADIYGPHYRDLFPDLRAYNPGVPGQEGSWAEPVPAASEDEAGARLKSLMEGKDPQGWFLNLDWNELATQLQARTDDFVRWMLSQEDDGVRTLFYVLANSHPVTMLIFMRKAAGHALLRSIRPVAAEIAASFMLERNQKELAGLMATCRETYLQMEGAAGEGYNEEDGVEFEDEDDEADEAEYIDQSQLRQE